jgi:hypothetical protein
MSVADQAAPAGSRPAALGTTVAAPADDLADTIQRAVTDLSDIAERLRGLTAGESDHAASTLAQLSGELARAAAMIRELPGRPPAAPGYTFAAATAIYAATRKEMTSRGGWPPSWPPSTRSSPAT